MNKKTSKFAGILKNRPSVKPLPIDTDKEEKIEIPKNLPLAKKSGLAKSKNPDYTQVSAYLPSSLYKKTKIKSLGNDLEFSELLEILLTKWNEDKIII
jgi:hypothetical protein